MKFTFKNSFFALGLATLAFACDNAGTKDDNVDGVVDSTAVSNPTVDEAMSTSPDTATVVRTDSTAVDEAKQMGKEAGNAVESGADKAGDAAHDATH